MNLLDLKRLSRLSSHIAAVVTASIFALSAITSAATPSSKLPAASQFGPHWSVLLRASYQTFGPDSRTKCAGFPFSGSAVTQTYSSRNATDQLKVSFILPGTESSFNKVVHWAEQCDGKAKSTPIPDPNLSTSTTKLSKSRIMTHLKGSLLYEGLGGVGASRVHLAQFYGWNGGPIVSAFYVGKASPATQMKVLARLARSLRTPTFST